MKTIKFFLPTLLLILSGCITTNPFSEFYTDNFQNAPASSLSKLETPSKNPQIFNSNNQESDNGNLLKQGYALLGYSAFQGGGVVNKAQLISQATKVGADIVLYTSKHQFAESGVTPFVTYNPGTTSTTQSHGDANANAYGNGRSAYASGSYSGTQTTQTSGTYQTQMVPYTVQHYEYAASFWRKLKPQLLGAMLVPLPDEIRASLGRNTGAYIYEIVENSPAFRANLLKGDVIVELNQKPVFSTQEFISLLQNYAGKKIVLKVLRGAEIKEIEVTLNHN